MRVHLDTSALCRPFGDQTQPRIWLETMAVAVILAATREGSLELLSSSVLEYESSRDPSAERRGLVRLCLAQASERCLVSPEVEDRARELAAKGLGALDALHIAAAEAGGADCFVACDRRLLARAACANVPVVGPLQFVQQATGGAA